MGKKRLKKRKVGAQPSVMAAAIPLSVETNEGFDRRMTVTGKITEGTIPPDIFLYDYSTGSSGTVHSF